MLIIPFISGTLLLVYCTFLYLRFDPNQIRFDTETVKIYDKNDTILWELSKENAVRNTPVSINNIPQFCKDAIISIEDRGFYDNIGVDLGGVARLIVSAASGGSLGGGSTISQQVIKNSYGSFYDRNALDKVNEIILSIKLNRVLTKDKILELYLNNVYFGQLNYGIESAAQDYFGKSSSDLNEAECSYLMGIPQYPGVYNPYGDIETGIARQNEVLTSMVRNNLIGDGMKSELLNIPLEFKFTGYSIRAPHFVEYIQKKYGVFKQNNPEEFEKLFSNSIPEKLSTTYDYSLHTKILELMNKEVLFHPDNSSSFVINKDGEILTMIGSRDYFSEEIDGKFNSALGLRQPGTLYNPLIYSYSLKFHGLDHRYPNLSFNKDIERGINTFENIRISNFGLKDSFDVRISDAINANLTVPAVRVIQEYEFMRVQNYLVASGITKQNYNDWCNDILNMEGCESTLVDLISALGNKLSDRSFELKDIKTYELENGSQMIFSNPSNLDLAELKPDTQLKETLKPEIFTKHLKGYTINRKDFWLFFYNQDFFAGFWFGNTNGDPINNYNSFIENINIDEYVEVLENNI